MGGKASTAKTQNKFHCPHCGGALDHVKDSRLGLLHGFNVIERRRQCIECGTRSTTIEMLNDDVLAMAMQFDAARKARIAALQAEIAALEAGA